MAVTPRTCPLRRQRGLIGMGLRRAPGKPQGGQFETTQTSSRAPVECGKAIPWFSWTGVAKERRTQGHGGKGQRQMAGSPEVNRVRGTQTCVEHIQEQHVWRAGRR